MIRYNTNTAALNPIDKYMETIFVRNPTSGNSHTGSGTETILDYVLIPANTFQANDMIEWDAVQTKAGTAGTYSTRLRLQTADPGVSGISGGAVFGLLTTGSANAVWNSIKRVMRCLNSLTSQLVHNTASTAIPIDYVSSSAAATTLSTDWTVNQYAVCTGQLGSSADTVTLRSWSCRVSRP